MDLSGFSSSIPLGYSSAVLEYMVPSPRLSQPHGWGIPPPGHGDFQGMQKSSAASNEASCTALVVPWWYLTARIRSPWSSAHTPRLADGPFWEKGVRITFGLAIEISTLNTTSPCRLLKYNYSASTQDLSCNRGSRRRIAAQVRRSNVPYYNAYVCNLVETEFAT